MISGIVASQLLLTQQGGGDSLFAFVSLLTSWDGVDGATTATDDSQFAHTPTFQGNAQIDTAQSVFGGASCLFGPAASRVRWANHSAFDIGNQPFCIEGRIRPSDVSGASRQVGGVWDTSGGSPQKSWRVNQASGRLKLEYSTDGTTTFDAGILIGPGGSAFTADTWYTFAIERDVSDVLRGYIDGVMEDSVAGFSANFFSSVKDLVFGQDPSGSSQFAGWLDEIRLIVGAAPYASDSGYTPLATPFPRS